jgi:hypothetical protein
MSTDFMPMPELATVAVGTAVNGERWTVKAGGSADRFVTLLEVELPDGRRHGVGSAGPLLPANHVVEVSTGIFEDGPLHLIGRSHPSIDRIRMEFADETPAIDLPLFGDPTEYNIRFFTTVLPRQTRIAQVLAVARGQIQEVWTGPWALP